MVTPSRGMKMVDKIVTKEGKVWKFVRFGPPRAGEYFISAGGKIIRAPQEWAEDDGKETYMDEGRMIVEL